MDLRVERGGVARETERPAGRREMRVHEEEPEARVREVLLDAAPHAAAGARGPGRPRAPRAIGAFGEPASLGRAPEEAAVLGGADGELKADALVAGEQRQEAVSGGRADDLEPSRGFERPERAHQVAIDLVEEAPQAPEPVAPEGDLRQEARLAGDGQRSRRLVTRGEPLIEERVHLLREQRARELVGEDGREPDRHRRGRVLGAEAPERLEQGEIGVQRRFAEPVAAVRPAAVVQHVGQVTVQREHEVHRPAVHRAPECATARR